MDKNVKAGADIHAGDGGYSIGTQEKYDTFVKDRNQSLGNMRIRELAEQATSIVEMVGPQGYTSSYANFDREKFAELIVRECTNVIEGGRFLHDQAPTALFAKECSGAIKRHFGVEE